VTLSTSVPLGAGTVNGWSSQQVSSVVSKSAHGLLLGPGEPEKSGGLGGVGPWATRPRSLATSGRVDGLMSHLNLPSNGTFISVLRWSVKVVSWLVGVSKLFFSERIAPGGASPSTTE